MTALPLRLGIIGAGDVNRLYLPVLTRHEEFDVVVIGDRHPERAQYLAQTHRVPQYGDVATALGADVEAVLNLTGPASHLVVTRAALERGLHVFSEKPLGTDLEEARTVLDLAATRDLVVACAPDTHLGRGFQDALRLLADGAVGDVVFSRCEAVLAGPESWHPRPQFLYARGGGPLFDIGPYYLTALIAALGPVASVQAVGTRRSPTRTIGSGPLQGSEFPVEVPSLTAATLQFASGTAGTVLLTFDSASHRGGAMEILGTRGTLRTPDPNGHEGTAALLPAGETQWQEVPLGSTGAGRPAGVVNFARAVRGTEPLRVSGDLAHHVLEVMLAVQGAAATGATVPVHSTAISPMVLPTGWNAALPHESKSDAGVV